MTARRRSGWPHGWPLAVAVMGCSPFAQSEDDGAAAETGTTDASTEDTAAQPQCITGQTKRCYEAPSQTLDVGLCRSGMRVCVGEQWGECAGQILPAAETCATEGDDDCDGSTECTPEPAWVQEFFEGTIFVGALSHASADSIVIGGSFRGFVNFGGRPLDSPGSSDDAFVGHYTGTGDHRNSWGFGGLNPQGIVDLVAAGDQVTYVGDLGDGRVMATADLETTEESWALAPVGAIEPVAMAASGANHVVVGNSDGVDFGIEPGPFVATFDPAGAVIDSHPLSGVVLHDVAASPAGIVFVGQLINTWSFAGVDYAISEFPFAPVIGMLGPDLSERWAVVVPDLELHHFFGSVPRGHEGVAIDDDGSVYALFNILLASLGRVPGLLVMRVRPDGEISWRNQALGTVDGIDIDATATSGLVIAGRLHAPIQFGTVTLAPPDTTRPFVVRYAPDGSVRWGLMLERYARGGASAVALTSDDDVLVAGHGRVGGNDGAFLVRVDG